MFENKFNNFLCFSTASTIFSLLLFSSKLPMLTSIFILTSALVTLELATIIPFLKLYFEIKSLHIKIVICESVIYNQTNKNIMKYLKVLITSINIKYVLKI